MDTKSLQKKAQKLLKQNKKTVATLVHFIPAPPLVYLIFDYAIPRILKRKDLKKFKNTKADYQFAFSKMPGVVKWTLEIDHGKARIYRGELDIPSLVINSSARDFIDVATGYLGEAKAVIGGRIGVNGGPASQMKTVMGLFM